MTNNTNPTLTIRDCGFDISVWFDRYDSGQPGRCCYGYRIVGQDHRDGDPIYGEGTDLTCVGEPNLPEALETLLSFLSAAQESYDHAGMEGENASLFPEALLSLNIGSDDWSYTRSWLVSDES